MPTLDTHAQNSFILNFQPQQHTLLGEGVWGRVYDLGDGSVLKIARETCSGVGSGQEKITREYEALRALAGLPELKDLLSTAMGTGEIPQHSDLRKDGFTVWLRTKKLHGQRLCISQIEELSEKDRNLVGASIGKTLAVLHRAMASLPKASLSMGEAKTQPDPYGDIKKAIAHDPICMACAKTLEEEWFKIPEDIRSRPAHNDYNTSNLLFEEYQVCAVLDFAEWGINFPEKDISDILKECPSLADPMVTAYEQELGWKTDPRRIALGIAENMLYGIAIYEGSGDMESAQRARGDLVRQLAGL